MTEHVPMAADRSPLLSLVEEWGDELATRSPTTAQKYVDAVNRVMRLLPPGEIDADTATHVYRTLLSRYSVASANLSIYAARSLWRKLIDHGLAVDNPWQRVRLRRGRPKIHQRILTESQVRALIDAAPTDIDRVYLRFLYVVGCRVEESVSVRWSDFRKDDGGGIVVEITGKGGRTRWVRVPPNLWEALQPLRRLSKDRVFPWSTVTAWRKVKRAARLAGLADMDPSPHWLRHSHASHALDNGIPIHVVQHELGHTSLATTSVYVHVRPGAGSGEVLDRALLTDPPARRPQEGR